MIRQLIASDTSMLARFFSLNNQPEIVKTFHPFPLNAESALKICAEPGKDRYFASFDGDVIEGFGMLRGWNEGYSIPSFGIFTDHRLQGRGVGRALTAYALKLSRELGCAKVRLSVHPDNARAVELYKKVGFEPAETLPNGLLVMFFEIQ